MVKLQCIANHVSYPNQLTNAQPYLSRFHACRYMQDHLACANPLLTQATYLLTHLRRAWSLTVAGPLRRRGDGIGMAQPPSYIPKGSPKRSLKALVLNHKTVCLCQPNSAKPSVSIRPPVRSIPPRNRAHVSPYRPRCLQGHRAANLECVSSVQSQNEKDSSKRLPD